LGSVGRILQTSVKSTYKKHSKTKNLFSTFYSQWKLSISWVALNQRHFCGLQLLKN